MEKYVEYIQPSGLNCVNTFVMKDDSIFVGIASKHFILKYDRDGRNVKVVANKDTGLSFPCIGGLTKDNHLLVSNRELFYKSARDI